jgi:arylsulfatase A-like enzyme
MSHKPNIIYIYADDLGRGMLSCYGQKHFRTPNIDRIAGEGMRFENAYGCAYCAPSRASMLTGTHDCHRGGWTMTQGGLYDKVTSGRMEVGELSELIHTVSLGAAPGQRFLAEIPREAGYATAQIGKLEWGFATTCRELRRHGWDYHYGYYDHAQCHGFYPPYVFENGTKLDIPGNTRDDFGKAPPDDSPENREERWSREGRAVYSQDLFDEKILEFLRKQGRSGQPFFLYHPSQLPHGPIIIPEIDPAVRDNPDLTVFEKEYASMVLRLDRSVGIILDELDRLGIAENTLVMFAADNGHEPGYYNQEGRCNANHDIHTGIPYDGVKTKFTSETSGDVFDGNDGMAGHKRDNFEGGVRLPFLARWPGVIDAGSVTHHLYANYDLMATVADITGTCSPEESDGISCLPELRGESERQQQHEAVIFASRQGPGLVTPEGWKLKQVNLPGNNLYQLYHLPDDRKEETDLKFEERGICERLSTILLRECDGNFLNGTPSSHQIWLPGINFYGPECHWDIIPG